MGLFLCSQFYSIEPYICFYSNIVLVLVSYSLLVSVLVSYILLYSIKSDYDISFRLLWLYLGTFIGPKFSSTSIFQRKIKLKKVIEILLRITLKLYIALGRVAF